MALIAGETHEQRCFELWRNRLEDAKEMRRPFDEIADEAIEMYMNNRVLDLPPGTEWMRNELLPEVFSTTESAVAQHALPILTDPRPIMIEAAQIVGSGVPRQVEQMLAQHRLRCHFAPRSVPAIRMAYLFGHVTQKNQWLRQAGEEWLPVFAQAQTNRSGEIIPGQLIEHQRVERLVFDGPMTTYPDFFNVWKSPTVDFTDRPYWWQERIPYDLDAMLEQQRLFWQLYREELYTPAALRELTTTTFSNGTGAGGASMRLTDAWERTTDARAQETTDELRFGRSAVMLHACYGLVPTESRGGYTYDDTQRRFQLFTPSGRLLRDEPLKWMPMRDIFMLRVGNEPYGRSPLHWTFGDVEKMSEVSILRLAETWTNILGGFIADRSVDWDQGDFIKYPGSIWFYDGDGRKPSDVLYPIPKQPVLPEAYHEVNAMFDRVQRVSGADQNAMGQAYGARTAATEVAMIDRKSGARTRLQTSMLAWQMIRTAAEDHFKLSQLYMDKGMDVQLPNEPDTLRRIYAQNLDFDVAVLANTAEFGAMNEMTLNAIVQGVGMFMDDPETRMHIDKRELIEEFFYRVGSPAALKILRRRQDVEAEQRSAQEMQLAMAALGGAPSGQ